MISRISTKPLKKDRPSIQLQGINSVMQLFETPIQIKSTKNIKYIEQINKINHHNTHGKYHGNYHANYHITHHVNQHIKNIYKNGKDKNGNYYSGNKQISNTIKKNNQTNKKNNYILHLLANKKYPIKQNIQQQKHKSKNSPYLPIKSYTTLNPKQNIYSNRYNTKKLLNINLPNKSNINNSLHINYKQNNHSLLFKSKLLINNNTSVQFRPGTNNTIRQYSKNNTAEDYNNYLNKYQIIKQLGKGMYGVVHLAKKKLGKIQKPINTRNYSLKLHVWKQGEQSKSVNKQLNNINNNNQINNLSSNVIQQELEFVQKINSNTERNINNIQQKQQNNNINTIQQPLYAIKVYEKFKMNKDPQKFKKIRKQILIMQNIQHPNIIQLYQTVQTLTKISLVVEYGGNQSLLDYLRKNHPITQKQQKKIGKQLLSAIGYLHSKNIVHRDIKLQNILLKGDQVKVIDFGFSTLSTYSITIANKTRKLKTTCGTPNYMAPEVISNQQYLGQNVDIWAYGIVMYAIGQGVHPFIAKNYNQLQRIVKKGVYQFKKIVGCVHQAFIKKILKINPDQRPDANQLSNHPWLNIQNQ